MPAVFKSLFGHSEVFIQIKDTNTRRCFEKKYWPQPTQPYLGEQTKQAFGGDGLDVANGNLLM